jgi:hypothetical protein
MDSASWLNYVCANFQALSMPVLSIRERIPIVLLGYLVVLIFAAVFVGLGFLPAGTLGPNAEALSTTERLILGAVVVAPLVVGLLWDRLENIKFGGLEIALTELTMAIDVQLAAAIQDMNSSATPELVRAVSTAIAKTDLKLVEVNLRAHPYWWSTRLFLLAALADEYTSIERLVIVSHDADRKFVGLASPASLRVALGSRFSELETVFGEILNQVRRPSVDPISQVEQFGYQWPAHSFGSAVNFLEESAFRILVSHEQLTTWLGTDLEIYARPWRRTALSKRSYARILNSHQPYVPLLNGSSLMSIVDRHELAERIAASVVS